MRKVKINTIEFGEITINAIQHVATIPGSENENTSVQMTAFSFTTTLTAEQVDALIFGE